MTNELKQARQKIDAITETINNLDKELAALAYRIEKLKQENTPDLIEKGALVAPEAKPEFIRQPPTTTPKNSEITKPIRDEILPVLKANEFSKENFVNVLEDRARQKIGFLQDFERDFEEFCSACKDQLRFARLDGLSKEVIKFALFAFESGEEINNIKHFDLINWWCKYWNISGLRINGTAVPCILGYYKPIFVPVWNRELNAEDKIQKLFFVNE